MELTNLESSLTLTPVSTGNEPFTLTYLMPLTVNAANLVAPPSLSYIPDEENAKHRTLQLLENGNAVDDYEIERQTNGTYLVRWRTVFAPHGSNILQMRLTFDYMPYQSIAVCGPKQIATVTNLLQWDYAATGFGRGTDFYGFLQVTSADYSIFIFDTNKSLIKTIVGHTEKGVIAEHWNVHPTNKYAWSAEDLKAEVYITPTVTDNTGLVKSNAPTVCIPYP
jgi:hypothetical protein